MVVVTVPRPRPVRYLARSGPATAAMVPPGRSRHATTAPGRGVQVPPVDDVLAGLDAATWTVAAAAPIDYVEVVRGEVELRSDPSTASVAAAAADTVVQCASLDVPLSVTLAWRPGNAEPSSY